MATGIARKPGNRIILDGRLYASVASDMAAKLDAASRDTQQEVVINMCGVTLLSAAGMKLLFSAASSLSGTKRRLTLLACQPDVADLIEILAPSQIVTIVETEVEGVGKTRGSLGMMVAPE